MKSKPENNASKALVTAFEDLETAKRVVEKLLDAGFSIDKMELVTHHIRDEAPEVQTPKVHETTASTIVESVTKWGGVGGGAGLLVGLLTPFPGLALGMAVMGGVTGAIVGGMAGIEHAVEDDSVNLPTLDEYEQMVKDGYALVVVQGNHQDVTRAGETIQEFPDIHRNVHPMHGHEHHEHPAKSSGSGSA